MRRAAPALLATVAGIGLLSQFKAAPEGQKIATKKVASKATATAKSGASTLPVTSAVDPTVPTVGPTVPRPVTTPIPPAKSTPPASASTSPAGTGSRTFTGSVAYNEFGPVQVEITIENGKLVDVQALQYPTEHRRSARISDMSLPILRSEAIAAQSASIDTVSGATYTSASYAESLQSALDLAHV